MKRYIVRLSPKDRSHLEQFTRTGQRSAQALTRARVLMMADAQVGHAKDQDIASTLQVSVEMVQRTRKKYLALGLEATLERQPRKDKGQPVKVDGRVEAHLIALACGPAPDDKPRWTLSLLAQRLVELEVVDGLSLESVRQVLKKTRLSLT